MSDSWNQNGAVLGLMREQINQLAWYLAEEKWRHRRHDITVTNVEPYHGKARTTD